MQTSTPNDLLRPLNEVELQYAPKALHVEGDSSLLRGGRRVAVVGSRRASDAGLKRATRIARILAAEKIVVVSGLAEGIDTAAHRTAIDSGGRTIAVLGTPLDQSYPRSNAGLQREIGQHHLLISQFAPGSRVQRGNFVMRNRTMALIADASVIVEAGDGSGTLSQGWEALRLGRPLLLLKSVVEDTALEWPAKMLDYGAVVVSDPEELLAVLPPQESGAFEDAPF